MTGGQAKVSEAAERYAVAAFELARDGGALDAVAADFESLSAMAASSDDLALLMASPAFAADDKARALAAVAEKAGFHDLTRRVIGVVAANRRVRELPGVARAFAALVAEHKGVVTAEVSSPTALSDAQIQALAGVLKKKVGADVRIETDVRPELLGGLVVKVGSRMFDSSLKTKLEGLKSAMKGA